jgi:hypothetical protein
VEIKPHVILISAEDGGGWSAACCGRLTLEERVAVPIIKGDWEGCQTSRDATTERKPVSLLEAEPWFSDRTNVVITPWLYLGGTWFCYEVTEYCDMSPESRNSGVRIDVHC